MMEDASLQEEIRRLLHTMQEGEATPETVARLDALVTTDPELCSYYVRYANLCGGLRWSRAHGGATTVLDLTQRAEAVAESPTVRPRTELSVSLAHQIPRWLRQRPIRQAVSAAIAVGLVAILVTNLRFWDRNEPLVLLPSQPKSGATTNESPIKSIRLQSGTATLAIENVGSVVIEGPANFEMLRAHRARLSQGKIKLRVTEEAGHGFTVETPDGDIVDLGTEFGVSVVEGERTSLAVFEGAVDVRVAGHLPRSPKAERLFGGDGVVFNRGGELDRINSIFTSDQKLFRCYGETATGELPLIANVFDNLPTESTKQFYEIVPKGLREDALAYVDRMEHNWNGIKPLVGIPECLLGADYVKTFQRDKKPTSQEFRLTIEVSRPARVFVIYDDRLTTPSWLTENFRRTKHRVGLDNGKWYSQKETRKQIGVGPGVSVDNTFYVWERNVYEPGKVNFGPNGTNKTTRYLVSMYGIAAVELDARDRKGLVLPNGQTQ